MVVKADIIRNEIKHIMSDFLKRLLDEQSELKTKLDKLTAFLQTDAFNDLNRNQQVLLKVQVKAMETYFTCLDERLKLL